MAFQRIILFQDGNKLVAFLASGLFLDLNGGCLVADLLEAIGVLFALTAGELTEKDLAMWIRWNMQNAE